MKQNIFDTHAHYSSSPFDENREELMPGLPAQGVALVVDCGTDLQSSKKSIALAEKYTWLYTAVGIHPTSLIEENSSTVAQFNTNWQAELEEITPLFFHEKVVAIGECGLDNHWPVPKKAQLELFEAQIKLSLEYDLPLIIHDREAHADTYALLKKYKPKGVLHSFSGSAEDVKWLTAQGIYIGFTGVLTFKNARRPLEAALAVPLDKLLFETDCPYMAPEPFRGKQSNSSMIRYTAERLAKEIKMDLDELLSKTMENGKNLFSIQ